MATGTNIRTYFEGAWHDGDVMIMRAADHGSWLGTTVFDGARYFDGVAPDLEAHCARVNRSAEALMITPTVSTEDMVDIVREGLNALSEATPPSTSARCTGRIDGGRPRRSCPSPARPASPSASRKSRWPPASRLDHADHHALPPPGARGSSVANAKAGCLYPNNARMLTEARSKGYGNALVADALGNVAETATANVFMVRDGEVFTPIPNGTFLAGITRARHIANLRADGRRGARDRPDLRRLPRRRTRSSCPAT